MGEKQPSCRTCKNPIQENDIDNGIVLQIGKDFYCPRCKKQIVSMFSKNITGGVPLMLTESTIKKGETRILAKKKSFSVITVALVMLLICGGIGAAVALLLPGRQGATISFKIDKVAKGEENAIKIDFNMDFPEDSTATLTEDGDSSKLADTVTKGSLLYKRAGKSYTLTVKKKGWKEKTYPINLKDDEYTRPKGYTSEFTAGQSLKIALQEEDDLAKLYSDVEEKLNSTDYSKRNYLDAESLVNKIIRDYDPKYKKIQEYKTDAIKRADIIREKNKKYEEADTDLKRNVSDSKAINDYKTFLKDLATKDDLKGNFYYFAEKDRSLITIRIDKIQHGQKADQAEKDINKPDGITNAKKVIGELETAKKNKLDLVTNDESIRKDKDIQKELAAFDEDIDQHIARVNKRIQDTGDRSVLKAKCEAIATPIEEGDLEKAKKSISELKALALDKELKDILEKHEGTIKEAEDHRKTYRKLLDDCTSFDDIEKVFNSLREVDIKLFTITKKDEKNKKQFRDSWDILAKVNETLVRLDEAYKEKNTEKLNVFSNADLKKIKEKEITEIPDNVKVAKSNHKIDTVTWPKDPTKKDATLAIKIKFSYTLEISLSGQDKPEYVHYKTLEPNVKVNAVNRDGTWKIEKYELIKEEPAK